MSLTVKDPICIERKKRRVYNSVMEKYTKQYDRVLQLKPFCVLSFVLSCILYILSIVMFRNSTAPAVKYIRDFSFLVMAVCFFGNVYLRLFMANFRINLDYCSIDPSPFEKNMRFIRFGMALCLILLPVSLVWSITLLVKFR